MLLKLVIRAEQMFEDLSQLMNDTGLKVILEYLMNMMIEIMKTEINEMIQRMDTAESRHTERFAYMYGDAHSNMSTNGDINYIKDVAEVDEEIGDSHTGISIDGYDNAAQCEYKGVPVYEDMSSNDHFQYQSFKNNIMKEPSAVEETSILQDASEASITTSDLVNDEVAKSTTLGEVFCSQDEIMMITDDPDNHINAPDDAQIELKPHTLHIKFVNVNIENKISVMIFVDMVAEKEGRLLQQEKRSNSSSSENIVDRKLKMHAYLFFPFDFNKNFTKFSKMCFCFKL